MNVVSLQDLSTFDLAAAANANLAVHASWAQRRTPGMRVIKTNDLVLVDSGLPCDSSTSCVALCINAFTPDERPWRPVIP